MQSDTQPLESAPLDSGPSPAEAQKTRAQMNQVFDKQGTRVAADQPRVGQVLVRQLIPTDILVEVWGVGHIWLPQFLFCGAMRCLINFSILFQDFPIQLGSAPSRAII